MADQKEKQEKGRPMTVIADGFDWSPFLQAGERLLWKAQPQRSVMLSHNAFFFAVCALLSLFFAWFALVPSNIAEACGQSPSVSCRKLYFLAWPGLIILGGVSVVSLIQFLLRLVGILRTHYAVTNLHAMTLWDGAYTKLRKVRLTNFEAFYRDIHSTILMADRRRPIMAFVGIDYEKYWELDEEFYKMRTSTP